MEEIDYAPLNCLLKASSKDVVVRLCNEAFLYRNVTSPSAVVNNTSNILSIENEEASQLFCSLCGLVRNALYQGSTEPADIAQLFPGDFHKNLRDLLGKILRENLPQWRTHTVNNLVSLPRLVDFDWRVDIKTSSTAVSRMSVPTCILQLQVQENATKVDQMPQVSNMNVELSKETLDTMLDGLSKIRNQLSSVAKKT